MIEQDEKLIEELTTLRNQLPEGDFDRVRAKVLAVVRSKIAPRHNWWGMGFIFNGSLVMPILIAILIAFGISGGVAIAAQNDLPDQPLYPVKLWTEQAEQALAFTPEAKINLAEKFAERRSEEVNTLLLRGPRHGESRDHFVTAVDRMTEHLSTAEDTLNALAKKNPARALTAVARLQAQVDVASNLLVEAKDLSPDASHEAALKKLKEKLQAAEEEVDSVADSVEKKVSVNDFEESDQGRLSALKNKSAEVVKKHDRAVSEGFKFSSETEAGLAAAEQKMKEAQSQYDAKQFRATYVVAKEAFRLFIESQQQMNIERAHAHFKKDAGTPEHSSVDSHIKVRLEGSDSAKVRINAGTSDSSTESN